METLAISFGNKSFLFFFTVFFLYFVLWQLVHTRKQTLQCLGVYWCMFYLCRHLQLSVIIEVWLKVFFQTRTFLLFWFWLYNDVVIFGFNCMILSWLGGKQQVVLCKSHRGMHSDIYTQLYLWGSWDCEQQEPSHATPGLMTLPPSSYCTW